MKKKKLALTLVAIIALAFVAVNLSNQQRGLLYSARALPSATSPSPTPVITSTLPEPTVSFTLWHTNSSVIQPPSDELAHIPPICEIVSPENQTVLQTNNFTVNVNVASYFWVIDSVYYNTDWIAGIHEIFGIQPSGTDAFNASITVNFSEVPDGNHTLMVYANTHDGSHSFATVIFSTEMHSPNLSKTEPFPILIVLEISALVVVAVTSIGLLVFRIYRKKRNRKKKNNLTQQTFQGIQISTFRRRL